MRIRIKLIAVVAIFQVTIALAIAFDIKVDSKRSQLPPSSIEGRFKKGKVALKGILAERGAIESCLSVIQANSWGGMSIYQIAKTTNGHIFCDYLSYPRGGDVVSPIRLSVGPLPESDGKTATQIFTVAKSLFQSELSENLIGESRLNVRRESFVLAILQFDESEQRLGINRSGSGNDWKAIDSLCSAIIELQKPRIAESLQQILDLMKLKLTERKANLQE